jgi:sugar/nucleoside kinase (ribokinase family)
MHRLTIVVVGYAGIDYIGTVGSYPKADDKIRTKSLVISGGGNAGNTSCCVSRLGVNCKLISKIGDDSNGNSIVKGLNEFNVDTSHVYKSETSNSGFVYVIVDDESKTRTCIATPMSDELNDSDVENAINVKQVLNNVNLVHFDSRHTLASIKLAEEANKQKVPISIDVEKDRPHLRQLLPLCDIVFTNEKFTSNYFSNLINNGNTGVLLPLLSTNNIENDEIFLKERLHLMTLLTINSNTKLVVTTLGSNGSILIKKIDNDTSVDSIFMEENESIIKSIVTNKHDISIKSYIYRAPNKSLYCVLYCPALKIDQKDIVDTTGAGDAYIGGFLVSYLANMTLQQSMKFATIVASENLKCQGARDCLPNIEKLESL